jgi:hypothetical protein
LNQENLINYDLYKFTLGNNCLFYLEQKKNLRKKNCEDELEIIKKNKHVINKSDYVIFSMRYYEEPVEKLNNFINKLNIDYKKVIIAGARNEFYRPVNLALNLVSGNKDRETSETKLFLNRKKHTDEFSNNLNDFAKKNNFKFLDLYKIACNTDYKKCDFYDDNYNLYYYDYGHWTKEGANFFGEKFVLELKKLISN